MHYCYYYFGLKSYWSCKVELCFRLGCDVAHKSVSSHDSGSELNQANVLCQKSFQFSQHVTWYSGYHKHIENKFKKSFKVNESTYWRAHTYVYTDTADSISHTWTAQQKYFQAHCPLSIGAVSIPTSSAFFSSSNMRSSTASAPSQE